jgi:hypothetical protein
MDKYNVIVEDESLLPALVTLFSQAKDYPNTVKYLKMWERILTKK